MQLLVLVKGFLHPVKSVIPFVAHYIGPEGIPPFLHSAPLRVGHLRPQLCQHFPGCLLHRFRLSCWRSGSPVGVGAVVGCVDLLLCGDRVSLHVQVALERVHALPFFRRQGRLLLHVFLVPCTRLGIFFLLGLLFVVFLLAAGHQHAPLLALIHRLVELFVLFQALVHALPEPVPQVLEAEAAAILRIDAPPGLCVMEEPVDDKSGVGHIEAVGPGAQVEGFLVDGVLSTLYPCLDRLDDPAARSCVRCGRVRCGCVARFRCLCGRRVICFRSSCSRCGVCSRRGIVRSRHARQRVFCARP